eukprot:COSAG05_NODE_1257_length_5359_cov_5.368251_4_plen_103_part_00
MQKLTAVIKASAVKQEKMMTRMAELTAMAKERKHSKSTGEAVKKLNEQVEKLGTITKLADMDLGDLVPGGSAEPSPPAVTFTPPSMENLKSMTGDGKDKEDL